jgi:hypothetical protein
MIGGFLFFLYNIFMENQTPEKPNTEIEIGPMMGIVIILLMLLAGAWYFLNQRVDKLEAQREQQNKILSSTTTIIDLGTTTEATSTK